MLRFTKPSIFAAAVLAASFVLPSTSFAVPLVAMEEIKDMLPLDPFARDLKRVRTDSSGVSVENHDPTIIAQNVVDPDFGILNKNNVSYKHRVDWIVPPVAQYTSAELEITAFGVLGSNDIVYADSFNLGPLNNGSLFTLFFSSTSFGSTDPVVLDLIFANGVLDIFIDKNQNGGYFANKNKISVFNSKLTVNYEPVPEPATMVLMGSGLVGLVAWRIRKGQPKSNA
jgi:hypothetical protein